MGGMGFEIVVNSRVNDGCWNRKTFLRKRGV